MVEFFTTTNIGILLLIVGQCLLVLVPILVALAFLMYADRKVWAAVQMRKGPNMVGAFGLLQSFADFLKYIVKEVVVPAGADKAVFFLAPLTTFVLAVIAWAVIPFNDGWILADINVAVLYIFAVSSLEIYGVIMGGWASNSKYAFLGSLRSAAQMISYEVSIGLIIIGIIISTGSLSFGDIVRAQDGDYGMFSWYWLPHFPMVFLFFISALAETNRPPFDLPEAESELVAGYQVEYSSTPFLLFMIGELMSVVLMCALVSLLFFGGWLSPVSWLPDGLFWLVIKILFFFFIFAMVKAITPRYRYDQLMRIGWKVFLPMSLGWVVLVAFFAQFGAFGGAYARWDREPDTIAAYIEQNCTPEFAVLNSAYTIYDGFEDMYNSEIGADGAIDDRSVNDNVLSLVFAGQIGAYVGVAGQDAPSDKGIAFLREMTDLAECLENKIASLNPEVAEPIVEYVESGGLTDSRAILDAAEVRG